MNPLKYMRVRHVHYTWEYRIHYWYPVYMVNLIYNYMIRVASRDLGGSQHPTQQHAYK